MVGFPSSPSQGHGGGLAAGVVLPMALWLKTPVGCLILVLVVKMGWLWMWDLQVGLIVGGCYGIGDVITGYLQLFHQVYDTLGFPEDEDYSFF